MGGCLVECYFRMLQELFLNAGGRIAYARFGIVFLLLSCICIGAIADNTASSIVYAELAPLDPGFVWKMDDPLTSPYQSGVMPSPVYRTNQKLLDSELELELYQVNPAQNALRAEGQNSNERLPASFSLRQYSRVPHVGDQGACDAGWTFASLGSLLSSVLPNKIDPFSQNHLKNTNGFDLGPCGGGNADITTAYLARWSGPVSAYEDPYSPASTESPNNLDAIAHLERTLVIPMANDPGHPSIIDLIKKIIMNEGAIYGAYYADDGFYFESDSLTTYYNPYPIERNAHGVIENVTGTYQGMLIVGWDDSIRRTDFNVAPPSHGAFLVQNSYSNKWGMNGFFYLSYYDVAFNQMNPVAFTAASVHDYDNIYQYDPFGNTQSYGAAESYAFANVFRSERDEVISGVGFYCTNPNAFYTIEIYASSDYIDLETATPISVQTGYQGLSGYYPTQLINPVSIKKHDYFAAVIRMTTPGRWYPVAVEVPIEGYSSGATAGPHQSYVSKDGAYWEDFASLELNGNVCLKVFTTTYAKDTIMPFPNGVGGYYPPPNDLDGDGRYEDIDGNFMFDGNDVEVFFANLDFAMSKQPVYAFDFDKSGFIGYGDVQALFEMVWR